MRSKAEINQKIEKLLKNSGLKYDSKLERTKIKNTYSYGQVGILKWVLGSQLDHTIKVNPEMKKAIIKYRENHTLQETAKNFRLSIVAVQIHLKPEYKENCYNNLKRRRKLKKK